MEKAYWEIMPSWTLLPHLQCMGRPLAIAQRWSDEALQIVEGYFCFTTASYILALRSGSEKEFWFTSYPVSHTSGSWKYSRLCSCYLLVSWKCPKSSLCTPPFPSAVLGSYRTDLCPDCSACNSWLIFRTAAVTKFCWWVVNITAFLACNFF